jgi:membrane-associated progesterone receptor component
MLTDTVQYSLAFLIPAAFLLWQFYPRKAQIVAPAAKSVDEQPKSIMQPPKTDLEPPKDTPFSPADLSQYDGTDESKPIYVAIKGTL